MPVMTFDRGRVVETNYFGQSRGFYNRPASPKQLTAYVHLACSSKMTERWDDISFPMVVCNYTTAQVTLASFPELPWNASIPIYTFKCTDP